VGSLHILAVNLIRCTDVHGREQYFCSQGCLSRGFPQPLLRGPGTSYLNMLRPRTLPVPPRSPPRTRSTHSHPCSFPETAHLKALSGELPLVIADVARKMEAESAQEPSFEKATHPSIAAGGSSLRSGRFDKKTGLHGKNSQPLSVVLTMREPHHHGLFKLRGVGLLRSLRKRAQTSGNVPRLWGSGTRDRGPKETGCIALTC
jgi:hypothetical protein